MITRHVRDRRRDGAASALEFFGDNAGARSWYVPSGDTVTRIIIGKSSGKLLGKSRKGVPRGRKKFRKIYLNHRNTCQHATKVIGAPTFFPERGGDTRVTEIKRAGILPCVWVLAFVRFKTLARRTVS